MKREGIGMPSTSDSDSVIWYRGIESYSKREELLQPRKAHLPDPTPRTKYWAVENEVVEEDGWKFERMPCMPLGVRGGGVLNVGVALANFSSLIPPPPPCSL